ncbi:MAG: flagellar protein FlaG [Sedimenticola sp.]|uniref:Flagellar protein FlaG n=1 Tax=Sedimenticola thiotaurini TaxID=1543721 RepID=A0A558CXU5_9GAMM|nr:flagellar protein FlaG [Sedimenticola sp.]TVT53586.1 MAG: flagellar protein FlaG [Sedimenticola thiotaurini]
MVNEISQGVLSSVSTQPKGATNSAGRVRESSDIEMVVPVPSSVPDKARKEAGRPSAVADGQKLNEAVDQLNEFAQSVQRKLEFSVDDESGKTVVKVIDKESGQMVRSIPSEEVLDMQKKLKETSEAIFNNGNEGISLLFQGKA